jgi:hypothetical protein
MAHFSNGEDEGVDEEVRNSAPPASCGPDPQKDAVKISSADVEARATP